MNRRNREILALMQPVVNVAMSRGKVGKLAEVRALSSDTTEIMVYGRIGSDGWYDDGVTSVGIAGQLREITTPNIHVRINSGGGDVFEGVAIHSLFAAHSATITTINDGYAASAASFIFQAGDKRKTARNAMVMIHDGATYTYGNEADHGEAMKLLGKVSDNIADMYAVRAGGTVESWRELMRAETWYTGSEAVEAGLADEVVGGEDDDGVTDRMRSVLNGARFLNAPPLPALKVVEPPALNSQEQAFALLSAFHFGH